MKPMLIIFVKAPLMGKVKTRLAADIGKVHAQRIYRAMCATVFRNAQDRRWQTVLYVTPDLCADQTYGGLWPQSLPRLTQGDGGLTERSARIFAYKGPLIAIGTDSPQIKRRDIANGFKALKFHDAVFGPAEDGGFWLIGLNGPATRGLFENIRWSHPETLSDMLAKIHGPVACLRTIIDVDDVNSYRQVKAGKSVP